MVQYSLHKIEYSLHEIEYSLHEVEYSLHKNNPHPNFLLGNNKSKSDATDLQFMGTHRICQHIGPETLNHCPENEKIAQFYGPETGILGGVCSIVSPWTKNNIVS